MQLGRAFCYISRGKLPDKLFFRKKKEEKKKEVLDGGRMLI